MSLARSWLQAQWLELTAVFPHKEKAATAFDNLSARYSENGRAYHNLDHIRFMLAVADEFQHLARDWTAVRLAIWYHDAVYQPDAADNEAMSAQLAGRDCALFGFYPELIQKVEALIMATRWQAPIEPDSDQPFIVDADLAILGSEPGRYAAYARGVRLEFSHISEADFKMGRSALLKDFLQRKRLYFLDAFHNRFEAQARYNLGQELNHWLAH